jgi:A/G-specific adenine glycosylase
MSKTRRDVKRLSSWYLKKARVLPWRETRDPYRIWISEVMLQQTQVTTVIPYYHRFLERFPAVAALAEAPEAEVLAAWSGLGYYSRARNLQKGAKALVARHGGEFPRTREAILEIPGIGPYTAGAVLSIAFDLPEPLVDGNVLRVFARYYGIDEPQTSRAAQKRYWSAAAEWVSLAESPRVLNQALMELGAMVCIKGTPRCGECPISESCVAFRESRQAELPPKKIRRAPVDLYWTGLVLEAKGRYFLHRNQKGEWWSDLWDFPRLVEKRAEDLAKVPRRVCESREVTAYERLGVQRHTVTHHRIHVAPLVLHLDEEKIPAPLAESSPRSSGQWFTRDEIERLPVSSLVRKVVSRVE